MKLYRKRARVVEALQWHDSDGKSALRDFVAPLKVEYGFQIEGGWCAVHLSPASLISVRSGDWIVKMSDDSFMVYSGKDFDAEYEPVLR